MPLGEIIRRTATLEEPRKERMTNLVREVGHGNFWTRPRLVQIAPMVAEKDVHGVLQTDIARVLGVSDSLVTRVKHQQEEHPDETPGDQDGRVN